MKSLRSWAAAAVVGLAACSDSTQNSPLAPADPEPLSSRSGIVRVTNSNDAGPGSFRAAAEAASADASIREIEFARGLPPISVLQPVVYTGPQKLKVDGNGAVIDGAALDPAAAAVFVANGGSDLTLSGLTFRNAPQQGLAVEIPAGSSGIKKIALINVSALGNRGHGILINDQADPLDTENPAGSDASLDVTVVDSRLVENGFGALNRDGLRINEGSNGDLVVLVTGTHAEGNGTDGIEFDERGVGDVRFKITASQFIRNGSFDQTLADLDDGLDIDESNEGSLIGSVTLSSANDNYEEGFDFNENHAGDFRVDMTLSEASRNLEEGIDFEEDDDFQGGGDLVATLIGIKADGNGPGGDAGLKIRERGDGDLETTVHRAQAAENLTGGISVREDAGGSLRASIDRPSADGNGGHGIDFDENGAGDLSAIARSGSSSDNGGAGVRADQQLPGTGELELTAVRLTGNAGGDVTGTGVTVMRTP